MPQIRQTQSWRLVDRAQRIRLRLATFLGSMKELRVLLQTNMHKMLSPSLGGIRLARLQTHRPSQFLRGSAAVLQTGAVRICSGVNVIPSMLYTPSCADMKQSGPDREH